MVKVIGMPKFGVTMKEGAVVEWLKKEGDQVNEGDELAVVETEKTTVTYEAHDSGVLLKYLVDLGETVPVKHPIAALGAPGENVPEDLVQPPSQPKVSTTSPPPKTEDVVGPGKPKGEVTPAARRIAESRGIDLSRIVGTGESGMIMREDVLKFIRKPEARMETPSASDSREGSKVVPLTGMRASIARRLSKSQQETAEVTLSREEDVSRAAQFLKELGSDSKVTYTDLFAKAASEALKRHPELNSWLERDDIRVFDSVNICIAVALEGGLITPTVFGAEKLSLVDLSARIGDLSDKARKGELSVDEVTGGTFTISNLGMFGVESFTPIINPPQTAILGIGRVKDKPWVVDDRIVIRPVVQLSLTFDHRVVDGADAARFLQTVVDLVKDVVWMKG